MTHSSASDERPAWVRRHVIGLRLVANLLVTVSIVALAVVVLPSEAYKATVGPGTYISLVGLACVLVLTRVALSARLLDALSAIFPTLLDHDFTTTPEVAATRQVIEEYVNKFVTSDWFARLDDVLATLLSPSAQVFRIHQEVTVDRFRSSVILTRQVDSSSPIIFPVLRFARGSVIGDIQITVDGNLTTPLASDDARGLLLSGLWLLWADCFGDTSAAEFDRIATVIASSSEINESHYRALMSSFDLLVHSAASEVTELRKQSLRQFIQIVLTSELILAILPELEKPSQRMLAVEYDEVINGKLRSVPARLGAAVGVGPNHFAIELPYVTEAPSFHLTVNGRVGSYVEIQPLWVQKPAESAAVVANLPTSNKVPVARKGLYAGDAKAHLYLKGFAGAPVIMEPVTSAARGISNQRAQLTPSCRVVVREIPPGLTGPILAVSLWLVVLTWLVGGLHDQIFTLKTTGSWSAIVFGLPSLVVGWLLSRAQPERIRNLSLRGFLLTSWLILNVAAILVIVALKSVGVAGEGLVPPVYEFLLGTRLDLLHDVWAILMISTAFHFVYCAISYVADNSRYATVVNGRA